MPCTRKLNVEPSVSSPRSDPTRNSWVSITLGAFPYRSTPLKIRVPCKRQCADYNIWQTRVAAAASMTFVSTPHGGAPCAVPPTRDSPQRASADRHFLRKCAFSCHRNVSAAPDVNLTCAQLTRDHSAVGLRSSYFMMCWITSNDFMAAHRNIWRCNRYEISLVGCDPAGYFAAPVRRWIEQRALRKWGWRK